MRRVGHLLGVRSNLGGIVLGTRLLSGGHQLDSSARKIVVVGKKVFLPLQSGVSPVRKGGRLGLGERRFVSRVAILGEVGPARSQWFQIATEWWLGFGVEACAQVLQECHHTEKCC